jgi:hypothetical protein
MKEVEAFKHRHAAEAKSFPSANGQICYNNARLWRQDAQRHQRRRTLRVARGRAARGRPWLGASEIHDPCAINSLKVPFELVLYEFPREVQEPYCASKGAVWPNSPGDVLYSEVELCLAHRLVVEDGQRDIGRPASTIFDHSRRTIPLAVIGTGGIGMAEV